MKMNFFKLSLLTLVLILFFISCEDEDDDVTLPTPVEANITNRVVFWSDFSGPPIRVFINSQEVGQITAVNSSPPGCSSSGTVIRTLSPGSYSYNGEETSAPFRTWSGNFTVESNVSCLNFLLRL